MAQRDTSDIKVLVADDETDFAATLTARLKLRDFKTRMVHSGKEALEDITIDKPDILILDLKMPDLDGLEVLEKMQHLVPEVKVIIVTGHGSFEAGREGMELGAFDYIMKPVDLNLLIQKIHDACQVK